MLTFGSLFAGIGGFDLGFERAGMVCKWQVEIDPFCQKVLAKHWPDVQRYGDIRHVGRNELETVDVICGGFPCQDISPASSTKSGLQGARSGLWSEYYRIICDLKPRFVVVENHSNLLSTNNGEDFGGILRGFSCAGYDAEWAMLPANYFGAGHQRKRVYLVAYSNKVYGRERVGPELYGPPAIFRAGTPKRDEFWIQTTPKADRVVNGISAQSYKNRVGACGNAVVPQIAEWLGRRIVEADKEFT